MARRGRSNAANDIMNLVAMFPWRFGSELPSRPPQARLLQPARPQAQPAEKLWCSVPTSAVPSPAAASRVARAFPPAEALAASRSSEQ